MAGDVKQKFGTSNQSMTVTNLHSLGNSTTAVWNSDAVDNSSNLYIDALVTVKIATNTSSGVSNGVAYVFAYGTTDGGTSYTDAVDGTEGAHTTIAQPNLRPIGRVNCATTNQTYTGGPFSVAAGFGGVLPEKWGIVIMNQTGNTLKSSGNSVFWQGVYAQYT